jgi:hypothetical protein
MHGNHPQQPQHSVLKSLGRTAARTCFGTWKRIFITIVCALVLIETGMLAGLVHVLVFGTEQVLGALLGIVLVVLIIAWAIGGIKRSTR